MYRIALLLALALPVAPAVAFPLDAPRPGARRPAPRPTVSLPLDERLLSARELKEPHHDYPAIDLEVRVGTPVMAIRPGRVRMVLHDGACGSGVIVDGAGGFRYTYCHASGVRVKQGDRVRAGQVIMASGISGSAENPHLHLEIEDGAGRLLCPQPLLTAWFEGRAMRTEHAPGRGCVG